jgi:hypothetical protein
MMLLLPIDEDVADKLVVCSLKEDYEVTFYDKELRTAIDVILGYYLTEEDYLEWIEKRE